MDTPLLVLYIEDDPALAQLIQLKIDESLCKLIVVNNAKEGIKKLQSEHFDAVIIDYNLPDMSSQELLKQIKAIKPILFIIILTACLNREIRDEVLKNGANLAIDKDVKGQYIKELSTVILQQR